MSNYLSQNIANLRREKRITQEQLAQKLKISAAAVSKWEKGKSLPDIDTTIKLADFFGVSLDMLVGCSNSLEDERIDSISENYFNLFSESGMNEAENYKEKMLNEYPKIEILKIAFAMSMQRCEILAEEAHEKDFLIKEQEKLLLSVTVNKDSMNYNLANYLLGAFYVREKNFEKAEQYLTTTHKEIYGDPDELLCALYMSKKNFKKAKEINEKLLLVAFNNLNSALFTATILDLKQDNINSAKALHNAHGNILSELKASGVFGHMHAQAGISIAHKLQNKDLMIESLKGYIESFLKENDNYSTLIFKVPKRPESASDAKYNIEIYKSMLEDLKNNESYAFVKEEKQFKNILNHLEKRIKE